MAFANIPSHWSLLSVCSDTTTLASSPGFSRPIVNTEIALSCLTSSDLSQVSQFLFEVPIGFENDSPHTGTSCGTALS